MADGIMGESRNPDSIRAAADAFRTLLGVEEKLALDFQNILKMLSRVFPKTKIKIVAAENAPALAWTDSKTLFVQKSVAEGLANGDVHARYIIAHEIGHLVLNHQGVSNYARDRSEHRDLQKQEMEAALFARELLLPSSLAKEPQTSSEVSAELQISQHAASNRIAELVTADELPLAPAIRARIDVVSQLIDLGYSEREISDLVVPKRTLARRRAEHELLTVEETDKALRLSRIAKQATRVFGDPAKANRWLRKPKRALNGESPVAFLASEEGARTVEEMLHQIDHGMAA